MTILLILIAEQSVWYMWLKLFATVLHMNISGAILI